MGNLDMDTARRRAREAHGAFLSSMPGVISGAVATTLGGVVAAFKVDPEWPDGAKAIVIGLASAVALGIFVYGLLVGLLVAAPKWQRDEARKRLHEIQAASHSYSITPIEATTAPVELDAILRVEIRNEGRGAQFAVVLEEIEGLDETFMDPHAHVYWMGRPDVLAEEIPPAEGRLIGVGMLKPYPDDVKARIYAFQPLSPTGEPWGRMYELPEGTTTVWIRVSARNVPEISYSRRIGVRLKWHVGDDGVAVELAPLVPPIESRVPSMTRLLDF